MVDAYHSQCTSVFLTSAHDFSVQPSWRNACNVYHRKMNKKKLFSLTLLPLTTLLPLFSHAEVNMQNGNYYKTWVDLEITNQNYTYQLRRTYDSRSLHQGLFGYGWCSDFEKSLEFRRSDQIVLRDCKLKVPIKYQKIKNTLYRSLTDPKDTLQVQDNTYERKTAHSLQKFNSNGQIVTLSNHQGFHLRFQYIPASGALQKILIQNFAEIVLKMDARSRLVRSVSTVGSPLITYRYDGANNLTSMTNAWNGKFDYAYDDFHNLTRVTYPDSTDEKLTYDKERDLILNIRTRDLCQDNFQWQQYGAKKLSQYKSSARRICSGKTINEAKFDFKNKSQKRNIATQTGE
ncbi:MAG: hypothetical protein EOP09_06530 [Proteobacteria bacterium]|nr:MAG: hypothetical protein EOP09_06530 [Pseudomonadota bacterium]